MLLFVDRRQVQLERWALASKSQMFSDVFGLEVEVLAAEE